ncbi:MAG: Bax inhibitor-1/YccA family protein, partial [Bacteroidota bacterium]
LMCYRSGLIKPTENFKLGVISATIGILILYIINFIGRFFGWSLPYLHDSGPIGIGISLVIVVVAALNLVIDFDFIERGSERSLPKYMEWYGAFGLLITLVWLYVEILRLLGKLRSQD